MNCPEQPVQHLQCGHLLLRQDMLREDNQSRAVESQFVPATGKTLAPSWTVAVTCRDISDVGPRCIRVSHRNFQDKVPQVSNVTSRLSRICAKAGVSRPAKPTICQTQTKRVNSRQLYQSYPQSKSFSSSKKQKKTAAKNPKDNLQLAAEAANTPAGLLSSNAIQG